VSHVLDHVIASIGEASQASGEAARVRVEAANADMLSRLAYALGAAQHSSRPRGAQRKIVVAIGDHGVGDPGIAMGAEHPSVLAAGAIADGSAALCQVARSSGTPILLIDAGAREPSHLPDIAVPLGRGATHDLMHEPAMTIVDAALALEAGIALAMSLAEPPAQPTTSPPSSPIARGTAAGLSSPALGAPGPALDVLALGAIGVGAEVASSALLGAITKRPVLGLRDDIAEAASIRGASAGRLGALELLATFGGAETAVLAGLILGCASINIPVILDSYATGAAALIAAQLAPAVRGYLVAAHRGSFTHPAILDHLDLKPIFEVGLGHGEGTGAAMVLPLVDQVVALR
jgi:nicotinate-nucleotide--dimethylbenzimidazole phosphoribosyltransferase